MPDSGLTYGGRDRYAEGRRFLTAAIEDFDVMASQCDEIVAEHPWWHSTRHRALWLRWRLRRHRRKFVAHLRATVR